MLSRDYASLRSRSVVQGILGLATLASGLIHSTNAFALEPWEVRPSVVSTDATGYEETDPEEVIEAGVALSLVFAGFGIGTGAAAAAKDAESEQLRGNWCRGCPGGFNDMQKDVEALGNASMFSFAAAGLMGLSTMLFAITYEEPKEDTDGKGTRKKTPSPSASMLVKGSQLGFEVKF